jgi:hypothetical protein
VRQVLVGLPVLLNLVSFFSCSGTAPDTNLLSHQGQRQSPVVFVQTIFVFYLIVEKFLLGLWASSMTPP